MDPIRSTGFRIWGYIQDFTEPVSRRITDVFRRIFASAPIRVEPSTEFLEHQRRVALSRKGMSKEKQLELVTISEKLIFEETNIRAKLDSLVDAFRAKRWNDPFFQDENFPHYARIAYTEGLITDREYLILGSCVSYRLDIPEKVQNSDLTCRLSDEQKITLVHTLQSIPNVDQSITSFLIALSQGDWKAQIFDDENFPHYALLSYMQGLITIQQLGTIQTYWALMQERGKDGVEVVRLFNPDGSVNEEARKSIEGTMDGSGPKMSETQLDKFFEIAKDFPYSEQQFFVTPAKKNEGEESIREVINGRAKFNLFSIFVNPPSYSRLQMSASNGMWEAAMQVYHKNPVKPQIVIGNSPPEDFFPSETRILSIPYPGVPQPSEADGHPVLSEIDFTYHDWYHIDFVSHIPPSERERMNKIVLYVQEEMEKTQNPLHKEFLDKLRLSLLDREFLIYKQIPVDWETRSLMFWGTFVSIFGGIFSILEESSLKEWLKKENKEKNYTFLTNLLQKIAQMPYHPSFDNRNFSERRYDEDLLKASTSKLDVAGNLDRTNDIRRVLVEIDPAKIIYEERGKIYADRSSTDIYYTHEDGMKRELEELRELKKIRDTDKDSKKNNLEQ